MLSRGAPRAPAARRTAAGAARPRRAGEPAWRAACGLLVLLLAATAAAAAGPAHRIRRIGVEDGLSHVAVYSILLDRQGFVWFATQGGLDRYDGFRVLRGGRQPGEPRRLPSDLGVIYQDAAGAMWVGTWGFGLHRWEPSTDALRSYRHDPANPASPSDDRIHALAEDGRGGLWVGTVRGLDRVDLADLSLERWSAGHAPAIADVHVWSLAPLPDGRLWVGTDTGLFLLDASGATAAVFRHDPADPASLPHDQVRSLLVDRRGRLWAGTLAGLAVLPGPAERRFLRLPVDPEDPTALADGIVNALLEDSTGRIWVGTAGGGLHRVLDPEAPGAFERFRHDPTDVRSLPDDDIRSLAEDRSGQLWVGTRGGGVGVLDPRPPRFERLLDETVQAIHVDRDGTLWAGTLDGVLRLARDGSEERLRSDPKDPGSLPHDDAQALLVDREGDLWVGTYRGLAVRDREGADFALPEGAPPALAGESIEVLLEGRDGGIWVGTRSAGLFHRDAAGAWSVRPRGSGEGALSDDHVRCLLEARDGSLWIGTDVGGLNRLRPDGRVERFGHRAGVPGTLSDNRVNGLWEDGSGTLWIATAYGLDRLVGDGGGDARFEAFFEDSGLPSSTILAVLGDEKGNLWVSSHGGLARIRPLPGGRLAVHTFGEGDGVQGPIFTAGAAFRSPSGELLFGGRNGINRFEPQRLRLADEPPPVVLTDVRVLGERPALDRPVTALDRLELTYRDTFFTFEAAALDFVDPQRNRFAWRLEGFDPDWVEGANRASYSRVAPGEYVLRVKAANSDGVWNEEGIALPIHISPPWWGTAWFRSLAVVLIAAALFGGHRARLRAVRRRNVELERLVAERTREAEARRRDAEEQRQRLEVTLEELRLASEQKSLFLGIAAHDLRSPLGGILSTTDLLLRLLGEGRVEPSLWRRFLGNVRATAEQMRTLVSDLLDVTAIETGRVKVQPRPLRLRDVVDEWTPLHLRLAEEKGIELAVELPPPDWQVFADRARVGEVLDNLLSNALKFTAAGGSVRLWCRRGDGEVEVFVGDSGQGLPPDELARVFDGGKLSARPTGGEASSGLGLLIVKKLVELQHGRVWAESRVGRGSTFGFSLPLAVAAEPAAAPQPTA